MPFMRDDDLSIHYLERGRGEPLLLIHGLAGTGADWAFQVAALEHRFRIIIPDLPGSGHSDPPRTGYTIAGFANALWKLMDHLGVAEPNIVGFSLGGAVALETATLRPASVPRLGLINSLATYRPRDIRKWLETYVSATIVRLLGMQRAAYLMSAALTSAAFQRWWPWWNLRRLIPTSDHCVGFSPAALASAPVVPISARTCASNSAGVRGIGSMPSVSKRSLTFGDCIVFTASRWNFSTISRGVFAGMNTPIQNG